LYWLFGPKNQSFRNKSGKTQPIRTKFGIRGQVKGWQGSGNFGRDRPILAKNGGWDESCGARVFFCLVNHATFRELRNGRFSPKTYFGVPSWNIRKDIFENFHFRGHLPQNLKSILGQTATSLRAGYRSRDALQRDTVYSTVYSPRARKFPRSGQLFSTTYRPTVAELYGASKLPNFRILAYFPHTKPIKRTFRWPVCSPGITSQNDCGPQSCIIFAYGKWLYPCRMLLQGASDLDQRCLKTRNSEDGCTFSPIIFAPAPKITPKPHFWAFQCKTYYTLSSP